MSFYGWKNSEETQNHSVTQGVSQCVKSLGNRHSTSSPSQWRAVTTSWRFLNPTAIRLYEHLIHNRWDDIS